MMVNRKTKLCNNSKTLNPLKNFLDELDNYIKQNINNLECNDIFHLYSDYFDSLKDYMGNSNGFTGLSELIIFRVVYHLLGGNFKLEYYDNSNELKYFVSKDNKYWIGENVGFDVGEKRRRYPDIVVCDNNDNVLRYIEIKLYPTNGIKTIDKAIEKMKPFIDKYPEMKAMLIMYKLGENSKITVALKNYKNKYKWFDYCLLKDNSEKISKVLGAFLKGIT